MNGLVGQRALSVYELGDMTKITTEVERLRAVAEEMRTKSDYDHRCVSQGLTKLEEASMWLCRAIVRPTVG